jgi:hypothetical protein
MIYLFIGCVFVRSGNGEKRRISVEDMERGYLSSWFISTMKKGCLSGRERQPF